ncbi:hypothetical protein [Streptomyces sp. NPDC101776]|uniref:hypothetical protein n=1 Tax=Streptomyces sp. NPDC101776 TaxID=3366146 RepID=UPI003815C5BA
MTTYKSYRHLLPDTRPHRPLDLPGWRDGRLALALVARDGMTPLSLWRRDGAPSTVTVPLPAAAVNARPRVLFEAGERAVVTWDEGGRALRVALPTEGFAVLIAVEPLGRD